MRINYVQFYPLLPTFFALVTIYLAFVKFADGQCIVMGNLKGTAKPDEASQEIGRKFVYDEKFSGEANVTESCRWGRAH